MENVNTWWKTMEYDFVKVPKALFRTPQYANLSPTAKLLYGFLLDRMGLSATKGDEWVNSDGEYYVIFTLEEILTRFGCGHDKAAALLKELEQAGLIRRTLVSKGKPYQIVVLPFVSESENKSPAKRKKSSEAIRKTDANKNQYNKNEITKTDTTTGEQRESVRREIEENISYWALLERIPRARLDGIVDLIVDTICDKTPTVRISGHEIPREEVCRRFFDLDDMDIGYVNDLLNTEEGEIRYLRGYILSRLYEAENWFDTFYTQWGERDKKKGLF